LQRVSSTALRDLTPIGATPVVVIEATRAAYDELRKSERKVADVLLADPRRILPATLAQTEELTRVSQPTVIRFRRGAEHQERFQQMKRGLNDLRFGGEP
jgi:DNA-binding MurR/RpiR family transcriptional regulator